MSVVFLNLKSAYNELKNEINLAISRVLESGCYIGGIEVEMFEDEFAKYCSAEQCISVGNGLDALKLSLIALGIGPGDEVLVPSNTFIASWLAVSECGATPIPVDPRVDTFNINVDLIEDKITSRTKAIMPVHLYGQPCDLHSIIALSKKYNLFIVEDAAQCHGAKYKGNRIGSHGDVVAWSFYPGKNLGAYGDGGAITTNNSDLAEKIKVLRNYGSKIKYIHEVKGVNSRLDPIQAAVLRVKLKYLDSWNSRRKAVAAAYLDSFICDRTLLPVVPEWADPVWHLFVIKTKNRDNLQLFMSDRDIETMIHYPLPPLRQKAYMNEYRAIKNNSNEIAKKIISIPIGPHLQPSEINSIIQAVNDFDHIHGL